VAGGTDGVCGLLAVGHHSPQAFGGTLKPIPAPGRDRWLVTSSWGSYVAVRWRALAGPKVLLRRTVPWGTQWGQLDLPRGPPTGFGPGGPCGVLGPGSARP